MKESPHLLFKLSKLEKGVRNVSISFNKTQREAFSRTSSAAWGCACPAGEECKGPPDIMDSRAIVTTMEKDTINFGAETNQIKIVALTPNRRVGNGYNTIQELLQVKLKQVNETSCKENFIKLKPFFERKKDEEQPPAKVGAKRPRIDKEARMEDIKSFRMHAELFNNESCQNAMNYALSENIKNSATEIDIKQISASSFTDGQLINIDCTQNITENIEPFLEVLDDKKLPIQLPLNQPNDIKKSGTGFKFTTPSQNEEVMEEIRKKKYQIYVRLLVRRESGVVGAAGAAGAAGVTGVADECLQNQVCQFKKIKFSIKELVSFLKESGSHLMGCPKIKFNYIKKTGLQDLVSNYNQLPQSDRQKFLQQIQDPTKMEHLYLDPEKECRDFIEDPAGICADLPLDDGGRRRIWKFYRQITSFFSKLFS